jgi:hypothetical protein
VAVGVLALHTDGVNLVWSGATPHGDSPYS